jgi:hypothetical protein
MNGGTFSASTEFLSTLHFHKRDISATGIDAMPVASEWVLAYVIGIILINHLKDDSRA